MSFSFWEQNTFIKSPDVVIIGSGIVGLNAAIALKKKSPSLHIVVLERGMLPYGASTRNAGFACFGSVSELLEDLETQTEDSVFSLVEKRWKGLLELRKLIGDSQMHFEPLGGFEVFTGADEKLYESCIGAIPKFNKYVSSITGLENTYRYAGEKISGFGLTNVNHLIENVSEGQIDTGLLMMSLLRIARSEGVEVLNGANVTSLNSTGQGVEIQLNGPGNKNSFCIRGRRAIICVNGFAKKFLPGVDVSPARAQVLITEPLPELKLKGTFHYDHGFYYFRNVGNRILLGGGRNLDFQGETTEEMLLTPLIQDKLETLLREMIIPGENYKVELRWSGIMGTGKIKSPVVQKTEEHIYCAVRMGGMGVAIGALTGNEVANLVLESI